MAYHKIIILFLVVQNVVESIVTQDGYDKLKEHRNENSKENPTLNQKSMAKPQNYLELFKEFQKANKNKGTF